MHEIGQYQDCLDSCQQQGRQDGQGAQVIAGNPDGNQGKYQKGKQNQ